MSDTTPPEAKTGKPMTLLREWRKATGLSLDKVGKGVGVVRETVRLYEEGMIRPSLAKKVKLAYVLNKTVEDIDRHFQVISLKRRSLI